MASEPMAVRHKTISLDDFQRLSRPAVGLPISRPWLGYADTLFLELGPLHERRRRRSDGSMCLSLKGEMTVMIHGGWRVERPRSVDFGMYSSDVKIRNGIDRLCGRSVKSISLVGRLSELLTELEGNLSVQSFACGAGGDWVLFLPEPNSDVGFWLTRDRGRNVVGMGYGPPFPSELWDQVTGNCATDMR